MRNRYMTGAALALSVVVGCGDEEDDSVSKCRAYIQAACEFFAACELIDEADVDDCADEFMIQGRTCEDAVRIASSYDECLDDLKDEDECTDDGSLPESCEQVITLE